MMPRTYMLAAAMLALSASTISLPTEGLAQQRPNILLVVADDLGWTDLASYGGEIDTPNLDALAADGAMFTDFHASVSCSPTRAMLLTGNDNHVAGLGNMAELLTENQVGQPGYEGHLNDRVATLAEVLRLGGYHTYMAGKWHLGHEKGSMPFDRGFEKSFSMLAPGASHWSDMRRTLPRYTGPTYSLNGKYLDALPADFYSSKNYANFLMDAIRENQGDSKPFFAYLAFTAPHDPLHVPEPWLSKYRGKYDDGYDVLKNARWRAAKDAGVLPQTAKLAEKPGVVTPWNELDKDKRAIEARGMEVYAGMVDALDYHYGRVVDFLKDIGEYDNTLIIFLSDNGPNPLYSSEYPGADRPGFMEQFDNSLDNIGYRHSNYAYGIGFATASSGPLDKYKFTVAEGGTRVPLLVAGPGVKRGQQIDAFAYVWDILPTILDLANVEYPAEFQGRCVEAPRGRSMRGLLAGAQQAIYHEGESIAGEMNGGKWIRQGAFKAVFVPNPFGHNEQLFDIIADPGEASDLSAEMPDKLATLKAAWEEYAAHVGVISDDPEGSTRPVDEAVAAGGRSDRDNLE